MATKIVTKLLMFFVLVALSTTALAQRGQMISGKDHPEQISDATAYRLYLINASQLPVGLQIAQLRDAGLSDADLLIVLPVLSQFALQFQNSVDAHNSKVASGAKVDGATAVSTIAALVASTRSTLNKMLSADGKAALDKFIQAEKARMSISPGVTE